MKNKSKMTGTMLAILLLALSFTLGPTSAQDEPPTLPVRVLTLQCTTTFTLTQPPTLDFTADGQILVFKVNPVGTVTGDLEGTFVQRITQVEPTDEVPAINLLQEIATFFTIETEEGVIEGYYSGPFYFSEETFPDPVSHQHGQILSVTSAYADLYLADVFYDGVVDYEEVDGKPFTVGDHGTLIIAPR